MINTGLIKYFEELKEQVQNIDVEEVSYVDDG